MNMKYEAAEKAKARLEKLYQGAHLEKPLESFYAE